MRDNWRRTLVACALLAVHLGGVVSQTTDVECLLPYFDWMSNSQNQNPCTVASNLLATCVGSYNVEALPESTHYLGPLSVFNATECQCNTVVYSLMSACGACQGRSYISWSQWGANCPMVSSGYPLSLPTGLHVPGWAYLDPRSSDTFDQVQAQRNADNLIESVVLPPSSSTTSDSTRPTNTRNSTSSHSHLSTSTTSQSSTNSSSPTEDVSLGSSNDSNTSRNETKTRVIIGATVGASVGALLLGGIVIWWIRQKAKRNQNGIQLVSPTEEKPQPTYNNSEHGSPTQPEPVPEIIIRERSEDRTPEHMLRYIEATVPIYSPSSSNTGTLPPASITASEPPSPTLPIHQHQHQHQHYTVQRD